MMRLSIRPTLLADAAITGATALLMLAGASPLGDLLDLPVALLATAGVVLIPYVGYLAWLAKHDAPPRAGVLSVIALNIGWALGCVGLLVSGLVEPNGLGIAFVLLQVVAVLVFADLQVMTLRTKPGMQRQSHQVLEV